MSGIYKSFIIILFIASFLFARQTAQYNNFVEAEITPDSNFTIQDINSLTQAPDSFPQIQQDGSVIIQIAEDIAANLTAEGAQIKILRSFILVQPLIGESNSISMSTTEYEFYENTTDVAIPSNGSYGYSLIDFSAYPAYTISSIDVYCGIRSSWVGYVYADFTDYPETGVYTMVNGENGYISKTKTGISTFNGKTLNRQWVLWAQEGYSTGGGYIDTWWVKMYHVNNSSYCTAAGTGDEYISEVIVGDVDNVSDSTGYGNYTSQSTTMNIGASYPIDIISAVNGQPGMGYDGDRLGIWVDWNHDNDFDDVGEMVYSVIDFGYFSTDITPPANAVLGNTRMRIRLAYNQTLTPCGTSYNGGEVEDYTINVQAAPIPKYSGGLGTEVEPYLIATPQDMNAIGSHPEDWTKNFKVIADIDLSAYTGNKFKTIGTLTTPFLGVFDGNNHNISNFNYQSTSTDYSAMFPYVGREAPIPGPGVIDLHPVIRSVWLDSPVINANKGATLIGSLKRGSCIWCWANGANVTCTNEAGGLIANIYEPNDVNNCDVTGIITGGDYVGGFASSFSGKISNCHFNGSVTGHNFVGGIAGHSSGTSLYKCYVVSALVTGNEDVGGLTGSSGWGSIENCFAQGHVIANSRGGGLTGDLLECNVIKSYAACVIPNVGGGLAGRADTCTFTSAFWDVNESGKSTSAGGTGKTTAQMHNRSTFTSAGWDFTNIWTMCDGTNYPHFIEQGKLLGDFACPDGVDFIDFSIFAKQWMRSKLSYDIAPADGDGIVNYLDFAIFAQSWTGDETELFDFASQWLQSGSYNADVAPLYAPNGDGIVDIKDLEEFALNWLMKI